MNHDEIKRKQLLDFLDNKVFDPVLEAMPEQYSSPRDRSMLKDVQVATRQEKEKFHYQLVTSQQIVDNYFRELSTESEGRVSKDLEDLELPRFKVLKEQFVDLCKQLDIIE